MVASRRCENGPQILIHEENCRQGVGGGVKYQENKKLPTHSLLRFGFDSSALWPWGDLLARVLLVVGASAVEWNDLEGKQGRLVVVVIVATEMRHLSLFAKDSGLSHFGARDSTSLPQTELLTSSYGELVCIYV